MNAVFALIVSAVIFYAAFKAANFLAAVSVILMPGFPRSPWLYCILPAAAMTAADLLLYKPLAHFLQNDLLVFASLGGGIFTVISLLCLFVQRRSGDWSYLPDTPQMRELVLTAPTASLIAGSLISAILIRITA